MSERDITPPKKINLKPKLMVVVVVVIALLALVLSSFFVVDQTEQSVVLLLGRYNRIVGPGLHFKLPLGIEKSYNVPTQKIQNMTFGFRTEKAGINTVYSSGDFPNESIMLTGDLNIVDVEWIIQYRITDARAWLFNVLYREKTIRDISQSILNSLVGDRAILDVIGPERTNIEVQAQEKINERFHNYGLGITVTTVKLKNIVPPKGEVQNAFEDVNKAIQDMNRLINEGKEQYNKEIPKAQGEAEKMVQVAQGYATERVNEAKGDVARFLSVLKEYKKNREITKSRLYIETIEKIFEDDKGTDLIDKDLTNFIPLKTLQQGVVK
ncbi:MAG: FtsH protease activity modulator HflK [Spirochaetes bacterium]|nr:MAG: FtsH protease activity modulator HflK [Spirochaetota bacterium]